jgi:hypothetical protein
LHEDVETARELEYSTWTLYLASMRFETAVVTDLTDQLGVDLAECRIAAVCVTMRLLEGVD